MPLQTIKLIVDEIDCYGGLENVYGKEICIQSSKETGVVIYPRLKDENDERSVYICLDFKQAEILANILLQLTK